MGEVTLDLDIRYESMIDYESIRDKVDEPDVRSVNYENVNLIHSYMIQLYVYSLKLFKCYQTYLSFTRRKKKDEEVGQQTEPERNNPGAG